MKSSKKPFALLYIFLSETNPNLKGTFYLNEGENIIGSSATCSLKLSFPQISPQHCKIVLLNTGEYTIQDMNSEHGCFLLNSSGEKTKCTPNKEYDVQENVPFYISKYKVILQLKDSKKPLPQKGGEEQSQVTKAAASSRGDMSGSDSEDEKKLKKKPSKSSVNNSKTNGNTKTEDEKKDNGSKGKNLANVKYEMPHQKSPGSREDSGNENSNHSIIIPKPLTKGKGGITDIKTQPIEDEASNESAGQMKKFQLKKAPPAEEEIVPTLIIPTQKNEDETPSSPYLRSPIGKNGGVLGTKGFGFVGKEEYDRKSDQGDKMDLENEGSAAGGFTKKFKPKGLTVAPEKSAPNSNENSNTEPFSSQGKRTTEKALTSKQRIIEEEKKRKEEEKRQKEEEEQRKKAEQERRMREESEKRRKEEEAARKKKEAEEKKRVEEKKKAEEKKRKEEEARRKKEEEEEAKRKKKEEEERKKREKEEEAKRKKEEAAAKKKKEEEAKKKKEMEERKRQESAKKKREEEIERKRKEEEAEEMTMRFLQEEEEAKRRNEEEELRMVLMLIEEEEKNARKPKGKAAGAKTTAKGKDDEDSDTEVEEEVKTTAGKKKVANTRKGKEVEETKKGRSKKDMDIEEEPPKKTAQTKSTAASKGIGREETPSKKKVAFAFDDAESDQEDSKKKKGVTATKGKKVVEEEKVATATRTSRGSKAQVEELLKASASKEVPKKSALKNSKKSHLLSVDSDEPSPLPSPRGSRSSSAKKTGRQNVDVEEEEKKSTKSKKVKGSAGETKEAPKATTRYSQQLTSSTKDTKEKPKPKASSQKVTTKTHFTAADEEVLLKRNSYQVLFSGLEKNAETEEIKKKFGLLVGVRVVDDIEKNFNVLVMDQFKRTAKFLYALNKGVEIVSFKWVIDSLNNGRILPTEDYPYSDSGSERKWNYKLQRSLELARRNQPGFLQDRKIWMAKTVVPSYEDLKLVVESAGGTLVASKPKEFKDDLIVIMNEDDNRNYDDLKNLGYVIYKPELVLSGSLQQKLNFKEHIIRHR